MNTNHLFFQLILSATIFLSAGCGKTNPTPEPAKVPPPSECNGHAELCSRRFDEVAFPATHNAMSNFEQGWGAANQNFSMKRQLDDGIRAMLFDTYEWNEDLYLCHSICQLGHSLFVDELKMIRSFLDEHPHEVLTFIIEDHITPSQTEKAFQAAGLADMMYTHEAGTPWPTLYDMIVSGKRIVAGAESAGPPPSWYHHIWDITWDTPYSFAKPEDFNCNLNRGSKDNDLFLMNHWLSDPLSTPDRAKVANEYGLLSSRAKQCQAEGGQIPNFVAVDFYDIGALFQVVDELNQL
ncbi:MAG TPA: PI-PLC domain-containing protein [Polyangium sp.]|nr:PI-PLC domain-containing protein [Polyangium sp.]